MTRLSGLEGDSPPQSTHDWFNDILYSSKHGVLKELAGMHSPWVFVPGHTGIPDLRWSAPHPTLDADVHVAGGYCTAKPHSYFRFCRLVRMLKLPLRMVKLPSSG